MRAPASPDGSKVKETTKVTCEQAIQALPVFLDAPEEVEKLVAREIRFHVLHCLNCQSDLARYRRVRRLLHQLRWQVIPSSDGAVAEILDAIEARATPTSARGVLQGRRATYAGVACALVAGLATTTVFVGRSRGGRSSSA
jgi:hypothetical protein